MTTAPSGLDIAASRTGDRVYLHVASLEYRRAVSATFAVRGRTVKAGRVIAVAPEDLRQNVGLDQPDIFRPSETALSPGPAPQWTFPAGSVSVVELELG